MTIVGYGARHDEHQSGDFTAQLIRVVAELSDATGTFLVKGGARRTAWLTAGHRAAVTASAGGAY
jgi:hypothetical protein